MYRLVAIQWCCRPATAPRARFQTSQRTAFETSPYATHPLVPCTPAAAKGARKSGGAAANAANAAAGALGASPCSKTEAQLRVDASKNLAKLREYAADGGVALAEGWRCELKPRSSGELPACLLGCAPYARYSDLL